jgi:hypothetical protein
MRDQWNMFAKMCRYPAIKDIAHFRNYYFNQIWLGSCELLYISYSTGKSPVTHQTFGNLLNKYGYRIDQNGASKTKLCADLFSLVLTPLAKLIFFKQECLWGLTHQLRQCDSLPTVTRPPVHSKSPRLDIHCICLSCSTSRPLVLCTGRVLLFLLKSKQSFFFSK